MAARDRRVAPARRIRCGTRARVSASVRQARLPVDRACRGTSRLAAVSVTPRCSLGVPRMAGPRICASARVAEERRSLWWEKQGKVRVSRDILSLLLKTYLNTLASSACVYTIMKVFYAI